ncbi:MAG: AzlD domain-containing protein [Pseudomonadota bacterium]
MGEAAIGPAAAWGAVALVAALTLASRFAGAALMRRVRLSPRVMRFLDGLSAAVLAAVVAALLAQNPGPREAAALAVAAAVMALTRRAVWAVAAGVACAAGWRALL